MSTAYGLDNGEWGCVLEVCAALADRATIAGTSHGWQLVAGCCWWQTPLEQVRGRWQCVWGVAVRFDRSLHQSSFLGVRLRQRVVCGDGQDTNHTRPYTFALRLRFAIVLRVCVDVLL
jgi:hypothetical protein